MTRSEQRVYRLAGALLGGVVLVVAIGVLAVAAGRGKSADLWSSALLVDRCPGEGAPTIAFPHDGPQQRTGEGALVWVRGGACAGGRSLRIAALDSDERAGPNQNVPLTPAPTSPTLALTGAPAGRVLLAAAGTLREGTVQRGPAMDTAAPPASGPLALTTAYRGQTAALYALRAGRGSALFLRRDPASASGPSTTPVAASATAPDALAVALDYRTDALAVWTQDGNVFARSLPRSSSPAPTQRLGSCGARPRLAALVSDDSRGIVACMTSDRGYTRIYAEISRPSVRFGALTPIEGYRDPHGEAPPPESLRLVRLSSERVLLAWPGALDGHYVVRVAHVAVSGVGPPITIAAPAGGDAFLADLAAGPRADALVLWTQRLAARHGEADGAAGEAGQQLLAAYGRLTSAGRPSFGAREEVARGAAAGSARVAFDPASDRAFAAWRTSAGELASATREAGD